MLKLKTIFATLVAVLVFASSAQAYYNPSKQPSKPTKNTVNFREACVTAQEQVDQDVNNVRARLTTGGDVWWDRGDGKYVVPKVPLGQTEVSSIYAGAVWLGGFDPGGNLKTACQTYGNRGGDSDFWPGPLTPDGGTTDKVTCDYWDRFFEVSGSEIQEHLSRVQEAAEGGRPYSDDELPLGVKGWPGRKNEFFADVHGFELPDNDQGLAGFYDVDGDRRYEPLDGDFPTIEIRGCDEFPDGTPRPPQFPDEMIFWIYNDEGGGAIHNETKGIPIRMEVQVQAFGYATSDQINDMTFQRYKLINRASEDIDSTYFAMWVDPDLGCHLDDYVGCDVERSLAYTYNIDAEDGQPGITCDGVPTYGTTIPIIGTDYFRGPLDEFGNELGMSSFQYYNNNINSPPSGTIDPGIDVEFYRYLSGSWRDGTRVTFGGDGYDPVAATDPANHINYAFPGDPDDANGWSMCKPGSEFPQGLPNFDRRTVQASGPFTLQPGAVNELIIGAVWVPNLDYPCPDITKLQFADDLAQDLFDNCFDITDGPDAPDVDWIAMDKEVIAVLTNKAAPASNNHLESYEEKVIGLPKDPPGLDSTYNFEGYLLYQVAGPTVQPAEFDDPTKAKLVYWVDVRNGIKALYNWEPVANPSSDIDQTQPEFLYVPEVKIEALDNGIRHTFSFTEDQFATGDRRLINHRKYYFTALAYGTNNFDLFNPTTEVGQKTTFLTGRRNIGPDGTGTPYTVIPRPIVDRKVNAVYGEGVQISRFDGEGAGGNFLELTDESREAIINRTFDGVITYENGRGPIGVQIYNPLEVKDGEFEVRFSDSNMSDDILDADAKWTLKDLNSGEEIAAEKTIDILNEQLFGQYGFSITIGQTGDAGDCTDDTIGAIGAESEYKDPTASNWFTAIKDGFTTTAFPFFTFNSAFDFIRFDEDEWFCEYDKYYSQLGDGYMVPYQLADFNSRVGSTDVNPFYITPAWRSQQNDLVADAETFLPDLNNVDIVFTSDKSKWSRCVVIEMFNTDYANFALTEDNQELRALGTTNQLNVNSFDLRASKSVTKDDNDGDGKPDIDTQDGGIGMGWFPGYAIDVETGKRLNIFFGENSAYRAETGFLDRYDDQEVGPNGADMMFNPTSQLLWPTDYLESAPDMLQNPLLYYAGGQHTIYVTNEDYYDPTYGECKFIRSKLDPAAADVIKVQALKHITWAGIPMLATGQKLLSYQDGLIPNEFIMKLRVDNPYRVSQGTGENNNYPAYRFKIEGKEAGELDKVGVNEALDQINVVPNPYYAFSDYEDSRLSNVVKITNLPAKCVVTIYSLDGKFIRQYNRDELPGQSFGSGTPSQQIIPDIEWDLKNSKGIPVSAGVYLIHVDAGILGERTLKWFGITRQYDPTGL